MELFQKNIHDEFYLNSLLSFENFKLENLKTLKEKLNYLGTLKDDEKEYLFTEIVNLLEKISQLNFFKLSYENTSLHENAQFFIENFSSKLLQAILNSEGYYDNPYTKCHKNKIIAFYVTNFIFMLKNFTEESNKISYFLFLKLFENVNEIFLDNKKFSQNFKVNIENYLETIYDQLNPDAEKWRDSLTPGSYIDYLQVDNDYRQSYPIYTNKKIGYGSWTRALILEIENNKNIKIKLLGGGSGISSNATISLNSCYILPYKTLSLDFEAREDLKRSSKVDILDSNGSWYLATVINKIEINNQFPFHNNYSNSGSSSNRSNTNSEKSYKLKIGMRLYRKEMIENTAKVSQSVPEAQRNYLGKPEGSDKDLNPHDWRIKMPNTLSKIIDNFDSIVNYPPSENIKSNELESYIPFEIKNKKFYSLPRKNHLELDYIHNINYFGENNGFNYFINILDSILNLQNSTELYIYEEQTFSFLLFCHIIDFLHNIYFYLHILFAREYLPIFLEKCLQVLTNYALSIENRFFKKEKFDTLICKIKDIMTKVYFDFNINAKIEIFTIDISIGLLKSNILDKKLIGLKMLTDIIQQCFGSSIFSNNNEKHISKEKISQIFKNNSIFSLIFGLDSHIQIVQKSSELIKNLISSKLFNEEEICILYNSAKTSDINLQVSIFNIISSNLIHLGSENQKYLIRLILDSKSEDKKDLELILCLQRSLFCNNENKLLNKEILAYFYNLIFNNTKENEFTEFLINNLVELLKSYDFKDHKSFFIQELCKKIKNENSIKNITNGLKILRRILVTCSNYDDQTKNKIKRVLFEDEDIIACLIIFIQDFIFKIGNSFNSEEFSNFTNEFFSFLNFICTIAYYQINYINKKYNFTETHIEILFTIYVNEFIEYSNLFFKFLKEGDDRKLLPSGIFENIFNQMATNKNLILQNISSELLNILWTIFLAINKNGEKLEMQNMPSNPAHMPQANSSQDNNNYNIILYCNPFDLFGFDLILKTILFSTYGDVSKNFIKKFLQIFKLFYKSEKDRAEIWGNFIKIIFINLKEQINLTMEVVKSTKNILSTNNKILNIFALIENLIEMSELKGTCGILPHSSLTQNNLYTLKIINNYHISNNINENIWNILELKVYNNNTLWDIKTILAKKLNILPETIILSKNNQNINNLNNNINNINNQLLIDFIESENNKSLNFLDIKNDEILTITKNCVIENLPKESFYINKSTNPHIPNEKFKSIVNEIFSMYSSENQLMSKEEISKYLCDVENTNSDFYPYNHEYKIKDIFKKYDTDKDNFLTSDDFLNYYVELGRTRENTVWEQFNSFGYRSDLKKSDSNLDSACSDKNYLPRFIIANNNEFFYLIFNLHNIQSLFVNSNNSPSHITIYNSFVLISQEVNKLINFLCTNSELFKNVSLNRENLFQNINLKNNSFLFLYVLDIIIYFFENLEIESCPELFNTIIQQENNNFIDSNPFEILIFNKFDLENNNLTNFRKINWVLNFMKNGELNNLLSIFLNYNYNFILDENHSKKILIKIISILKNSFYLLSYNENNQKIENILFSIIKENSPDYKPIQLENTKLMVLDEINFMDEENKNKLKYNEIKKLIASNIDFAFIYNNYSSFIKKLMEIQLLLIKQKITNDDIVLISSINNFLSLCLVSQNQNNFIDFIFENNFDELIINGLILNTFDKLNQNYFIFLKTLAKYFLEINQPKLIIYLFNVLHKTIIETDISFNYNYQNLFNLEESLILLAYSNSYILQNLEIKLEILTTYLLDCVVINNNFNENIFLGFLKILIVIMENDNKLKLLICENYDLIKILINKYLFKEKVNSLSSSNNNVNFNSLISEEIRDKIFQICSILMEDNFINISKLFETKFSQILNENKKWSNNYNPNNEKKSVTGYVGMKNLGCICYINAVIQQFFHIPSFRNSIMQLSSMVQNNNFMQDLNGDQVDDNVIHQFQRMFTFLQFSDKISFNPKDFCFAFKGLDGKPTNVYIQQDSQEFVSRIFDVLENLLKPTEFNYLLPSVFGGKICNRLTCISCGTVKVKLEDFYMLSLEVKNFKNIKESLQKFCLEEKIDGWKCERCEKVTTCVKKNTLGGLPNILVVHLQRILFNYDKLQNEKINSRFEFPNNLDLKEYFSLENFETKREVPSRKISCETMDVEMETETGDCLENYFEYILVGVVIHSGHADGGHYYSHINTNRDGHNNTWDYSTSNSKWLTFNDSSVTFFDSSRIEEECFGGCENNNGSDIQIEDINQVSNWNNNNNANINNFESGKSAYLLIYERRIKTPIKMLNVTLGFQNNDIVDSNYADDLNFFNKEINANVQFYDTTKNEYFYYTPFYNFNNLNLLNQTYLLEVLNDNIDFYNDQKIFNPNFNQFFEKALINFKSILDKIKYNNIQNTSEFNENKIITIFEVIIEYFFDVLSISFFKNNINSISEKIRIISFNEKIFSKIILEYISKKKSFIYEILFSNFNTSNFYEYKYLLTNSIICNVEEEATLGFLDNLINLLPVTVSVYWTKSLNYFELLEEIIKTGNPKIIDFFIKKELITKLIDFSLGRDSPFFSKEQNRQEIGKSAKLAPLINIVSLLGCYCYTSTWTEEIFKFNSTFPHTYSSLCEVSGNINLIFVKDKEENIANPYTLSENDIKMIQNKLFHIYSIREGYNNSALGRLLAHLSYNNLKFSYFAIFNIYESINKGTSLQEAKLCFDLIQDILKIEDDFTIIRMELIFGIPQPNIILQQGTQPYLNVNISNSGEKLFKFISPIISNNTNYESLTETMLYKFYKSYDYLFTINHFLTDLLFSSPSALLYFDKLPHPKFNKFSGLTALDYLKELWEEEKKRCSDKSNFEHIMKNLTENFSNYEEIKSKYIENCKYIMKDYYLKMNYRAGNIYSDVFYYCDHISSSMRQEFLVRSIYLICEDLEIEVKIDFDSKILNLNSKLGVGNYLPYDPKDKLEEVPKLYGNQNEGESAFYNNLISKLNSSSDDRKLRRKIKSHINDKTIIHNVIRKYFLYNTSNIDYKITFKFKTLIPDTLNTYLPNSDIIVLSRRNSGTTVLFLIKEDHLKPYGDIVIDLKIEMLVSDHSSNLNNINLYFQDEQIHAQQNNNLNISIEQISTAAIPLEPASINISSANEDIQLDCQSCLRSNFISSNATAFICQFCKKDLL